jgi:preprotein translocase subunit SecD
MDRGWYLRFSVVSLLLVASALVVWPSVDGLLPESLRSPAWVNERVNSRIAPGLDVKGGLRLTYEVEVDDAIRERRDRLADDILDRLGVEFGIFKAEDMPTREQLDKVRERVKIEKVGDREIRATFPKPEDSKKLTLEMVRKFGDLKIESGEGKPVVNLAIREDMVDELRSTAVGQARETIADRIDKLGVRETSVTARGTDIAIEIPGADEASFARIRDIISRTARLEFKIVDDESTFVQELSDLPEGISRASEGVSAGTENPNASSSYLWAEGEGSRQKLSAYVESLKPRFPEGRELLLGPLDRDPEGDGKAAKEAWRTYMLNTRADVTGEDVKEAFTAFDQENNKPYVSLTFNQKGADKFQRLTGRNVKRRMAIVLDDVAKSAPVIQQEIGGGNCQITLGATQAYNTVLKEAKDLVVVLRAGALPAPIRPSNEQLIGPSLGKDAIEKGGMGALVGIVLVVFFMLIYYQVGGLIADVAVLMNLLMLFALMALFEATLTLPGVAGIALTVGMAVDANVLINERIREELRAGKSARAAVDQGFDRAFWSIFDGQITTFIAGVVLFQYGTGPIKGFAVTLMIGIATSLFTGVFCSRVFFDWVVRGLRVKTLNVG